MSILYINEHLNCFNYDTAKKPVIEQVRIVKGHKAVSSPLYNEVHFILEGRVNYEFKACPGHDTGKGEILFIPSGRNYSCKALAHASILVFRISGPIALCANYSIEKLYKESSESKNGNDNTIYEPVTRHLAGLEINARLWHFLEGITDCMADGLKCRCWFEMKIKEFFLMLRAYYPREDIRDFLYPILSRDTAFSEHVRTCWKGFRTVNELAAFMHMTPKQFSTRFAAVFGTTPYKWMQEGRARIIRHEITSTGKLFKQIAIENGFVSDSLFTRFCKTTFGKTPTEIRQDKTKVNL